MNLSLISKEDWLKFQSNYPVANNFLVKSSLKGELTMLENKKRKSSLSEMENERLLELMEYQHLWK